MNEAAAPSPARGGASGFAFGVPNQHRGVPFNWFLFERRQTRRLGTSAEHACAMSELLVVESQKVWFKDNTTFKIGAAATVS